MSLDVQNSIFYICGVHGGNESLDMQQPQDMKRPQDMSQPMDTQPTNLQIYRSQNLQTYSIKNIEAKGGGAAGEATPHSLGVIWVDVGL